MSTVHHRPRVLWGLWAVLAWLLLADTGRAETLDAITNPKTTRNAWVSDMAAVIDEDTERRLEAVLNQLEQRTSAEIAVVTIRRTDGRTPKEFATVLFKHWGIGKKEKDNGVLVLLVLEARRLEVETGYGVEGILPDGKVGEILDRRVVPRFKQSDFGGGLLAGVQAMADVLTAAEASPSGTARPAKDSVVSPSTSPLVIVSIVLGAGLVLLLGGFYVRRAGRRYCPQCHRLMRRLTEDQDDAYLSEAQQFEEELGSVDYRVWRCDDCQLCTMERARRWSRYEDCPECGHRTVYEESHVVHEPTYVQNGVREVQRACRSPSCSYRLSQRYNIPPKEVSSGGGGWVSAGGGSWASSGGRGRVSGGGGGSFGGGSSGGGGAGRSW